MTWNWFGKSSSEKEESVRQRQKLRRELEHQKEIMLAEFDKKLKKNVRASIHWIRFRMSQCHLKRMARELNGAGCLQ